MYTLSLYLRDSLAELLRERKERVAKAEAIKYQEEEEVRARGHSRLRKRLITDGPSWFLARFAGISTEDRRYQSHPRVVRQVEGQV